MAEVICRQLKCGPPENIKPFSHVVKHIPPSRFYDPITGFACEGYEPGLGCCNPTRPNCSENSYILSLTCARPEPELLNKSEKNTEFMCYTPQLMNQKQAGGPLAVIVDRNSIKYLRVQPSFSSLLVSTYIGTQPVMVWWCGGGGIGYFATDVDTQGCRPSARQHVRAYSETP
jgi:hypothetical protein